MCNCACKSKDTDEMCDFCKENPSQCHKNKGAFAPLYQSPKCGSCASFSPMYTKSKCVGYCSMKSAAVDIFFTCEKHTPKY